MSAILHRQEMAANDLPILWVLYCVNAMFANSRRSGIFLRQLGMNYWFGSSAKKWECHHYQKSIWKMYPCG